VSGRTGVKNTREKFKNVVSSECFGSKYMGQCVLWFSLNILRKVNLSIDNTVQQEQNRSVTKA